MTSSPVRWRHRLKIFCMSSYHGKEHPYQILWPYLSLLGLKTSIVDTDDVFYPQSIIFMGSFFSFSRQSMPGNKQSIFFINCREYFMNCRYMILSVDVWYWLSIYDIDCRLAEIDCRLADIDCRLADLDCRLADINWR